ncbi:hypothetical protein [Sutcliffiella horikoshii]|uniref:Uncharacterized protein n=1 Tax=Sutcliffiella horikoshii TaxID=79883 RepID=A0A5D4T1M7_9BACI|nr:hypothetical protein [Sutcliffiella horikoshii]TYS68016.1 hypothetical protein FZC75_18650 [Sutcliffiella horikoshii]
MIFWIVVSIVVVAILVFGYLLDRKTDRYKSMSDKKVKEGIETIKDEAQRQGPADISKHLGP